MGWRKLKEQHLAGINFDPATAALISIDLQFGVVALPAAPHKGTDVVSRAADVAEALRGVGGTIVWVNVVPPIGKTALLPETDTPPPTYPAFPENWSDLVPELRIEPEDVRVTKRNWGAFYGTDLDLHLRRRGIKTLIIVGIATNLGVESTARDAYERAYQQVFVEDAMSGLGEAAHNNAITAVFPRMGKVRSTAELLTDLRSTKG
jgi:nicotinamidase-related amidase